MMCNMAPPHSEGALQRLATLVIRRRSELGLNKIDVARAAQLQINTYSKVEDGKSVRPTTYTKIEDVLGWANSSCIDILDGASAATLIEKGESGGVISPVLNGDLARDIEQAVQNAAVAVSDSLTSAEIRDLKRHVVEDLIKRGKIPDFDQN